MKELNKAVPAVYLMMVKERNILLGLRQNTGYQDGSWGLPSGHIEAGELPRQAVAREVKEEVGVDLNPDKVVFVHVSYRQKHNDTGDRCDFFFVAHEWSGEIVNNEPHKCSEWKWFPVDDLPENIIPHLRAVIQNVGMYLGRDKYYSQFDSESLKQG